MNEHRLELADVFRKHETDFLTVWGSVLSPPQKKARLARPLEQRRTSGGKARNTGLPKCGNVFSNHNCCLRLCNAELVPPASSGKKRLARQEPPKPPVYLSEWGGKFGITLAQITRAACSAITRSSESEIPCLSSAGPPLLQRSALASVTAARPAGWFNCLVRQ